MFESDDDFTDHSTANGPKKPKKKPKQPPLVSKAQGAKTGGDYARGAAERGAILRELNPPVPVTKTVKKK